MLAKRVRDQCDVSARIQRRLWPCLSRYHIYSVSRWQLAIFGRQHQHPAVLSIPIDLTTSDPLRQVYAHLRSFPREGASPCTVSPMCSPHAGPQKALPSHYWALSLTPFCDIPAETEIGPHRLHAEQQPCLVRPLKSSWWTVDDPLVVPPRRKKIELSLPSYCSTCGAVCATVLVWHDGVDDDCHNSAGSKTKTASSWASGNRGHPRDLPPGGNCPGKLRPLVDKYCGRGDSESRNTREKSTVIACSFR